MKSRTEKILEKADSLFKECGFDIKAKDVIGKNVVCDHSSKFPLPLVSKVTSFYINYHENNEICLSLDKEGALNAVTLSKNEKGYSRDIVTKKPHKKENCSVIFFDFIQ